MRSAAGPPCRRPGSRRWTGSPATACSAGRGTSPIASCRPATWRRSASSATTPSAITPAGPRSRSSPWGSRLGPDDWAVRCNLMTILDGRMTDFTAEHITSEEGAALIAALADRVKAEGHAIEFHPGVSYRNALIYRGRPGSAPFDDDTTTTPPHDVPDQPAVDHLPRGKGSDLLRSLMDAGAEVLRDHPVNRARIAAGKRPANAIWLWGQGKAPQRPDLRRAPRDQGGDHLRRRPRPRHRPARRLDPDRRPRRHRLPRHRLRRQGPLRDRGPEGPRPRLRPRRGPRRGQPRGPRRRQGRGHRTDRRRDRRPAPPRPRGPRRLPPARLARPLDHAPDPCPRPRPRPLGPLRDRPRRLGHALRRDRRRARPAGRSSTRAGG